MGRAPKKVGTPGSYNLAATKKKKKHDARNKTKKLAGKKKKVGRPAVSAKKGSARKNNYRDDFMHAASLF
jgi:hypothetical protein